MEKYKLQGNFTRKSFFDPGFTGETKNRENCNTIGKTAITLGKTNRISNTV